MISPPNLRSSFDLRLLGVSRSYCCYCCYCCCCCCCCCYYYCCDCYCCSCSSSCSHSYCRCYYYCYCYCYCYCYWCCCCYCYCGSGMMLNPPPPGVMRKFCIPPNPAAESPLAESLLAPLVTDTTLPAYGAGGEMKLEPPAEVRCRRGGGEERDAYI